MGKYAGVGFTDWGDPPTPGCGLTVWFPLLPWWGRRYVTYLGEYGTGWWVFGVRLNAELVGWGMGSIHGVRLTFGWGNRSVRVAYEGPQTEVDGDA